MGLFFLYEVPETSGDTNGELDADASTTVRLPGMMHRHRKMFQLGSRLGFMYPIHFIAPFTDTNKHTDRCSMRQAKMLAFAPAYLFFFFKKQPANVRMGTKDFQCMLQLSCSCDDMLRTSLDSLDSFLLD